MGGDDTSSVPKVGEDQVHALHAAIHKVMQQRREDRLRLADVFFLEQGGSSGNFVRRTFVRRTEKQQESLRRSISGEEPLQKGSIDINPASEVPSAQPFSESIINEQYASLLFDYISAYTRLEQRYTQLLTAFTDDPFSVYARSSSVSVRVSFPSDGVIEGEELGSPVQFSRSLVGVSTTVRIEIDEDPLTVEQMGLLFSTLSSLATKYWLISQGRFADLIEFTKSHDERFVREAQAVITRISYNSPLNFDIKLSVTDAVQGIVTTIDGIVQGKQRLKQMELATRTKESELHQAELRFAEELKQLQQQEAFEQEKRQLELARQQLEVERLRLEVAQQRLGFLEARLEMQSKSLDHAFEIAQRVINQLHPQADEATKRMLVQTYVGDILQLTEVSFTSVTVVEVDQVPPVDKDKEQ